MTWSSCSCYYEDHEPPVLWYPVRVYFAFKVFKFKCNTSSGKWTNELCSIQSPV